MNKLSGAILGAIILFGTISCASVTNPDNELRIACYKGEGKVGGLLTNKGEGALEGARISQTGKIDADVHYTSEDGSCIVDYYGSTSKEAE